MTGITPTPWVRGKQHPCSIFSEAGGNFMATTCLLANEGTERQQEIDDARYIVAAVNACAAAGLTVEDLESNALETWKDAIKQWIAMPQSDREQAANIIRAAPKLLKACHYALDLILDKRGSKWVNGREIINSLKAAIQAAEGDQPC